jgi:hypothetical protein
VLDGEDGPARDVVLLNAGAALFIAGKANSVQDGIQLAATTIDRHEERQTLEHLIAVSVAEESVGRSWRMTAPVAAPADLLATIITGDEEARVRESRESYDALASRADSNRSSWCVSVRVVANGSNQHRCRVQTTLASRGVLRADYNPVTIARSHEPPARCHFGADGADIFDGALEHRAPFALR